VIKEKGQKSLGLEPGASTLGTEEPVAWGYSGGRQSILLASLIVLSALRVGCVLQGSGKVAEGRKEVMAAEKLMQDILEKEWTPAQSEKDFEDLVFFWSR
jgi:hypothetical protein